MVATTKPQQKATAKINMRRKAKKHSKPLSIEKQLEALQYSNQQIAKIKACSGSSKTLLFLIKNHDALKKLGYTTDQLTKIAANDGGSHNLESLLKNHHALKRLGYTTNQVTKIAANSGGSHNLESLLDNHDSLEKLSYTTDQLAKIAANHGGKLNLNALLKNHGALKRLGYKIEQLAKIAANDGGSLNLAALLKKGATLKKCGYTTDQIALIPSHKGGALTLSFLIQHHDTFLEKGYTTTQLTEAASHTSGSCALKMILDHHDLLSGKEYAYTTDQIIKMASHDGGRTTLETIIKYHTQLKQHGLSNAEITQLSLSDGASKTILFVVNAHAELLQKGMENHEIAKMCGGNSASSRIAAFLCAYDLLSLTSHANHLKEIFYTFFSEGESHLIFRIAAFFATKKIPFDSEQFKKTFDEKKKSLGQDILSTEFTIQKTPKKRAVLKLPETREVKRNRAENAVINSPIPAGYTIETVPGDGNCFYHAVIKQCRQNGINHPFLHEANPVNALRRALDEPLNSRVWATQLTIQKFAEKFGMIGILYSELEVGRPQLQFHFTDKNGAYNFTQDYTDIPAQLRAHRPIMIVFQKSKEHFDSISACPPSMEQQFSHAQRTRRRPADMDIAHQDAAIERRPTQPRPFSHNFASFFRAAACGKKSEEESLMQYRKLYS